MEVIRDDVWLKCLDDAMKMYRITEPNEQCYKLADVTWKLKKSYKKHQQQKNERQVVLIDKAPEVVSEQRSTTKKMCAAITMAGKPCAFKAVCGAFCKKHQVKMSTLGAKVDVKKIKIED
jgi:NAD(P)H-dependent flavin oxidoreductase YrpB (nitropropane dioxygenase family)